jgi:cytoskeletal protein RodZ
MVQNNYSLLPDNKADDPGSALDLKAIRESKGLTLKDIFKMTRISVVNLEAIENNDLHLLPAPVYTKTFIKTYARALGVDSKNILARYAKHLESLKGPLVEEETVKPARKFAIPPPVLIWSGAAIVFCSLIFLSLALHNKTDVEVGGPLRSPEAAKSVPDGAAQPSPAPAAVPPQAEIVPAKAEQAPIPDPAPPRKKSAAAGVPAPAPVVAEENKPKVDAGPAHYHVSITAKELTWLKIVSDQNPPDEIMLKPGDTISRSAAESIRLDIGNAGGIDAEFQGKPLGILGKSGEVVHLTLP